MGKIIAVTNQKGGVGKTTTSVNLSAALGALGQRVLLVDYDPQGNTTQGLGIDKKALKTSSYDVTVSGLGAVQAIYATRFENLFILPATNALLGAEIELVEVERRETVLKRALAAVRDEYDFIFIDCPPSLGLLTLNALVAADRVLLPIQCEFYALEGMSQLMENVRTVRRLYNPHLDLEGVLLTMYDGRLNLTQQVVQEIKKYFPRKLYQTVIPRSVRLSEAPSFGLPILYYDRPSKGSKAYENLAAEFLARNEAVQ